MSIIFNSINEYFIEMIKNDQTRQQLKYRLSQPIEDRQNNPMPETSNMHDAFYVVAGCRFQDKPLITLIVTLGFLVAVGLTVANLITKLL